MLHWIVHTGERERACVCFGVPDLSSSESFSVVLLEPDSLRFMVGHCARLIAVADFFKGMHRFVLYYIGYSM